MFCISLIISLHRHSMTTYYPMILKEITKIILKKGIFLHIYYNRFYILQQFCLKVLQNKTIIYNDQKYILD